MSNDSCLNCLFYLFAVCWKAMNGRMPFDYDVVWVTCVFIAGPMWSFVLFSFNPYASLNKLCTFWYCYLYVVWTVMCMCVCKPRRNSHVYAYEYTSYIGKHHILGICDDDEKKNQHSGAHSASAMSHVVRCGFFYTTPAGMYQRVFRFVY